MPAVQDLWFIRLPDGRVIRARSTRSVLYHLRRGRIAPQCRVRRHPGEPWRLLYERPEFAAMLPRVRRSAKTTVISAPRAKARPSQAARRAHSARGMAHQLLSAVDSSLSRPKLAGACLLGVLIGLSGLALRWSPFGLGEWASALLVAGAGLALLFAACCVSCLLTQMTFIELSHLRSARTREIWPAVLRHAMRLFVGTLLAIGIGAGLVALRGLPGWLVENAPEWLAGANMVLRLVLEAALWPILFLAPLLLGPLLVVEESTIFRGIRQWAGLLRQHLGRVLVHESLAIALGILFTAPLMIPVVLAAWPLPADGTLALVATPTLYFLSGLALTPLIVYVFVANVFIYLNLRYEFFQSR